MTKSLNDKQKRFLEVLYHEAKGDVRVAMNIAGYSESTPKKHVLDSLSDEIAAETRKFLSTEASIKAAYTMFDSMSEDANPLGLKERMAAAKDLMNRGGFSESHTVEVKGNSPLFILPPKDDNN